MPFRNPIVQSCQNRVKPGSLRDVKTEAVLMFSRTALEGYFDKIDDVNYAPSVGSKEDTEYVYNTLRTLLKNLQDSVVHADYVINLVKEAHRRPELIPQLNHEASLILYYDVLAKSVDNFYKNKKVYLPEFLVICVLADWILEEEKSMAFYPFLEKIDFLELMSKFESQRSFFERDNECVISDIHGISLRIMKKLKKKKAPKRKHTFTGLKRAV